VTVQIRDFPNLFAHWTTKKAGGWWGWEEFKTDWRPDGWTWASELRVASSNIKTDTVI
jgi:hypothetical protein